MEYQNIVKFQNFLIATNKKTVVLQTRIATNFVTFLAGREPTCELVKEFANTGMKKSIIKYFLLANEIEFEKESKVEDPTISEYQQITDFLKYKEFTSCQRATLYDYKNKLEKYYKRYSYLTEENVIDFLKNEKITVKATYLSLFKQFFNFHKRYLNIPIRKKDIKIARRESSRIKVLFDDQLRKIEAYIEKLDETDYDQYLVKTILIVYMYTGCRVSELRDKMFSEINFKDKEIWVVGKGNKPRPVSLEANSKLLKFLKRHRNKYKEQLANQDLPIILNRNFQKISVNSIQKKVKKVFQELGFEKNKSIHSLRHSYGTTLANNDVDKYTISDALGHSNTETTEGYVKFSKQMRNRTKGKFKI